MKYKCLIIGLGRIGFGYDAGIKNSDFQLSHASTIAKSPHFDLVGGIDINPESRDYFSKLYGVPSHENFQTLSEQIDVVIISSSTISHYETFKLALTLNPRVILLEKPIAQNSADAKEIVRLSKNSNAQIFLNYTRNYIPVFQKISNMIKADEFLGPFDFTGWYTGEFVNSGTHMIALLQLFFGNQLIISNSSTQKTLKLINERNEISINNLKFFEGSFFAFEIIGKNAVVRYDSHWETLTISKLEQSKVYSDESILGNPIETFKTNESNCLKHVYNEIFNYFNDLNYYHSNLEDAELNLALLNFHLAD